MVDIIWIGPNGSKADSLGVFFIKLPTLAFNFLMGMEELPGTI